MVSRSQISLAAVRRRIRRISVSRPTINGPDLWAEFASDAGAHIHTSTLNIAWMARHGVANTQFRFEDMLEFWYSKLIPMNDGMVYDIGAHRGRHTGVFAQFGRPVVAFEPNPFIREILAANAVAWPLTTVRSEAVCNAEGTGTFTVNTSAPEESGIKRRLYNDEASAQVVEIPVQFAKLDDVHVESDAISFIKIDTEGGEIDIIRGARSTLAHHRPVLSVEYGFAGYSSYGHVASTLLDLVEEMDYVAYDIFGFRVDCSNWVQVIDAFCWDFILVPREQMHVHAAISSLRLALAGTIRRYVIGQ